LSKSLNSSLVKLPTPSNIHIFYNFGFLLGISMVIQFIRGLVLARSYRVYSSTFFDVFNVMFESDYGYILRYVHSNGASLLFFLIYIHIGRGIYYRSFKDLGTWYVGIILLLVLMATAFIGYVLPLNQISYWGCLVITRIFREIPYIGPRVVSIIWGGREISLNTVNRFFSFHFLLPFLIIFLIVSHIFSLHTEGSRNPLGLRSKYMKSVFYCYSLKKDILSFFLLISLYTQFCFFKPLVLGDNENFVQANSMDTPHHIQPEWYFLFAYGILRCIPNKIGGVLALVISIIILFFLPFMCSYKIKGSSFSKSYKFMFFLFIVVFITLTWLGSCPVEEPYYIIAKFCSFFYFIYFLTIFNF